MRPNSRLLNRLIEEVTVDTVNDAERFEAFRQAFEDNLDMPCGGFVVGQAVSITAFHFDDNVLRGVTATCVLKDGSKHTIAACDLVLTAESGGADYIAAYRKWLGVKPFVRAVPRTAPRSTASSLQERCSCVVVSLPPALKSN